MATFPSRRIGLHRLYNIFLSVNNLYIPTLIDWPRVLYKYTRGTGHDILDYGERELVTLRGGGVEKKMKIKKTKGSETFFLIWIIKGVRMPHR